MRLDQLKRESWSECFLCRWAGFVVKMPDGTDSPVYIWPRYKLNYDARIPFRQWNLRIQSEAPDGPLKSQNWTALVCLEHSAILEGVQYGLALEEVQLSEAYHSYMERKER